MEFKGSAVVAADPIAAVIIDNDAIRTACANCRQRGAMPEAIDPLRPETLVNPGLIKAACELLDVDHAWLYRFWRSCCSFVPWHFLKSSSVAKCPAEWWPTSPPQRLQVRTE
jgi:hypothetical protein